MQRLKTRPQFQATLAGGTVSRTAHFALHRLVWATEPQVASETAPTSGSAPETAQTLFGFPQLWMGAMVPKRWARRAVTRNAIKRQIYTVSTLFEQRLPQAAHVVRLRSGFDRKQFVSASSDALKTAVRNELIELFTRACPKEAA